MRAKRMTLRLISFVLLLAVIALGWLLSAEIKLVQEQKVQIDNLSGRLASKIIAETADNRSKCTTQAEKVFRELGYNRAASILENHFSGKFNACFMSISADAGESRFLLDAYEGKEYASFIQTFPKGKLPLVFCSFSPLGGAETSCKSLDEYTDFIEKYLTD